MVRRGFQELNSTPEEAGRHHPPDPSGGSGGKGGGQRGQAESSLQPLSVEMEEGVDHAEARRREGKRRGRAAPSTGGEASASSGGLFVRGSLGVRQQSLRPVTNGFRILKLRRSTVIKVARGMIYLTIASVVTATALLLWGLVVDDMEVHLIAWWTAGIAVALAVPISLHEILMHMLHYVKPELQRYYIRILWMVPIFAIESWMSLRFKTQGLWLEMLRECYEAYVIYSFFRLMLEYLGGEDNIKHVLSTKGRNHARMPWPFHKVKSWRYDDGSFVENCRIGVFVFVFVRLICAVVTLIMGYIVDPSPSHDSPYLYVRRTMTVLINLAQIAALSSLAIFYHDLKDELRPLRPLGKFLAVKAVVFFSFWQGLVIYALGKNGLIPSSDNYSKEEVSQGLEDYLLCWEMAAAAVAHTFVFSYRDFNEHFLTLSDRVKKSFLTKAFQDMIMPKDFADETVHHAQSAVGAVSKVMPSITSPFNSNGSSSSCVPILPTNSSSSLFSINNTVMTTAANTSTEDEDEEEEEEGDQVEEQKGKAEAAESGDPSLSSSSPSFLMGFKSALPEMRSPSIMTIEEGKEQHHGTAARAARK